MRIDDSEIPQEFYIDNAFFDAELRETVQRKVPAKRYTNSVCIVLVSLSLNDYTFLQDRPMLEWMGTGGKPSFRQEFFLELLWWKGHRDNYIFQVCPQCSTGMATYRCDGCSRGLLSRQSCKFAIAYDRDAFATFVRQLLILITDAEIGGGTICYNVLVGSRALSAARACRRLALHQS